MTRSPPATSTTAAHRRAFSSAVRVGDSPVVPATTSVSVPWSSRWRARRWAPVTSRVPSGWKGVAMAVSTRPRRAWLPQLAFALVTGLVAAVLLNLLVGPGDLARLVGLPVAAVVGALA